MNAQRRRQRLVSDAAMLWAKRLRHHVAGARPAPMRQIQHEITVKTTGQKLVEVTRPIANIVKGSGLATGAAHLFCPHTSASLTIQENADPDVRTDLESYFKRLVPDGDPRYTHRTEGPDDMATH